MKTESVELKLNRTAHRLEIEEAKREAQDAKTEYIAMMAGIELPEDEGMEPEQEPEQE